MVRALDTVATSDLLYDPYSYEIDADPYPIYKRMRDEAPVYHNQELDFFALTRFDDCIEAFRDWESFSSAKSTVLEMMTGDDFPGSMMIFMDPPRQTQYRALVARAFTKSRIARLEPSIREIAVGHLEKLEGRQIFDAVQDFTAKLPIDVISTLLGIPEEDRDQVRAWSNDILHRDHGSPNVTPRGIEAMQGSQTYYQACIDDRRKRPRDDMMTDLTTAEIRNEDGEFVRLSDEEIRAFFMLLATAGNETVTKLMAQSIYWLARFPEQRCLLVENPELATNAAEEFLRFDPPSQYQGRWLTRELTLHGVTMPKDSRVLLVNGATGRDERRFTNPDELDLRRDVEIQLGLGFGRHLCLGAQLARMEMRIGLQEFLARWPEYDAPPDGIERIHSSNVRGMSGLRIEV
jgi:cytochrome P450